MERFGGRVKFPSGPIIKYVLYGQRMPDVGKEYLFYLKYNRSGRAFQIITAYGFDRDLTVPLDGSNASPKGSERRWVMDTYNGLAKDRFISLVQEDLSKSSRL